MRRTLLLLILTLALVASACSGDDSWFTGSDGDPGNDTDNGGTSSGVTNAGEVVIEVGGEEIVLASGLSGFDDCDALLDHLRTEAAERVGPYGFNGGGWYPGWFGEDVMMAVDEMAFDTDAGSSDDSADFAESAPTAAEADGGDGARLVEGVDFSGTNLQEIGVDEADLVKTDGERVFILANNELTIVDVNRRSVVASMDLVDVGWNAEMFLLGDEILLVSNTWGDFGRILPVEGSTSGDAEAGFADSDEAIFPRGDYYETSMVNIARISVAGNDPELLEAIVVEGEYVSARSIDGVARVIIRSSPQQNFPFVYPQSEKGEDVATSANQDAVRNSELSDWLPSYVTIDDSSQATDRGILSNCGQVHAPTEFAGFGVLTVLSVPVDGDINPNQNTSLLAPGNTVYASTDAIFVATQTWVDPIIFEDGTFEDPENAWEEAWNARQTSIHRFALSGDGAAYTASGAVAGDVRDQFSFSDYDGHLRVITTTGESWDESSETFVRVLRESDGELREVGSVGDMGNGEAVQSVRMIGDVGYVVTFRQVDPFYTLDLSDPENPRVVGELKIPGFSSYLHPIGNGRVLGVGSDGTDDGRITGSKVSIFDVSDPADPQEVAIWTAPDGWTDVGWDHRSFLWWEAEQLAVVPVQIWSEGWAGAVVLKVDGNEIREVGRIDHIDEGGSPGSSDCERLTAGDLPGGTDDEEFETELQWMLQDDYSRVLVCGPDDSHKASGFECYDEPYFAEEAERIGLDLPSDSTLVICWRNEQLPVIGRTMVIDGDELWSISGQWGLNPQSPARVQLNDLFDLDLLETIQIG
jgi:hypothetical protein